jgi:hypothetical protein
VNRRERSKEEDLARLRWIANELTKVRAEINWLEWEYQRLQTRIESDDWSSAVPEDDFDLPQLEASLGLYFDRVAEAWVQRKRVLVRVYCDQDVPRRSLGRVFETPLGPLLDSFVADDPESERESRVDFRKRRLERVLLEQPLGPWWVPVVRCRRHGEAVLNVEDLLSKASKGLQHPDRPPSRFAVRCGVIS